MYCDMRTFNGDHAFLGFGGRIESGADMERLKLIFDAFASGEYCCVVIDLADVAYFDPRVVDIVAEAIERNHDTRIRIANSTQEVRNRIRAKLPVTAGIFTEEEAKTGSDKADPEIAIRSTQPPTAALTRNRGSRDTRVPPGSTGFHAVAQLFHGSVRLSKRSNRLLKRRS